MQVLQLDTIEGYVERLRQDADEAVLLFRDFLIGVTSFFRDREAFDVLSTWSRVCSTDAERTTLCASGSRAARPARRHTRLSVHVMEAGLPA